jgi:hypothetical protein
VEIAEVFNRRWVPVPETGCWLWTGHKSSNYGGMYVHGVQVLAHRLSYVLHHGPIPKGMMVCHKCDTPMCVNPAHLFVGTARDNTLDAIAKGRFKYVYNEKPGRPTRHSPELIEEVRANKDGLSERQLCQKYGISKGVVHRMKHWEGYGNATDL